MMTMQRRGKRGTEGTAVVQHRDRMRNSACQAAWLNVETLGHVARLRGRPPSSAPFLIECPVCPEFIDHAWCESIAWEWATIHDEREAHDAGTAYVVGPGAV
jgi:hypothetical protein